MEGDGKAAAARSSGRLPQASKEEILACQFSSWYSTFRNIQEACLVDDSRAPRHKNVTIKSVVIPLPSTFVDYLLSDGVRLPVGATRLSSFAPADEDNDGGWASDEDGEANDETSRSDSDEPQQFSFPQLNEEIKGAISSLGGSVIPKLNWSSPKDATWVNNGTLRCETPGDVYILLKSSDFVLHDILHTFDNTQGDEAVGTAAEEVLVDELRRTTLEERREIDYELILRKWSNLHASQEFRCFVADHELVAISQRNHTQHFPHLTSDLMTIRSQIDDFFLDTIRGRFSSGAVPCYVFDCYVDKNGRVWLLDFNAWSARTDTLLFEWDELLGMSAGGANGSDVVPSSFSSGDEESKDECDAVISLENVMPEMRVVQTEMEVHHNPLASYRAPIDTVDLASDASGADSFKEFMAKCERPSNI